MSSENETFPVKHLSASSVKKYNACPYAWKMHYILHLDQPKSEHLAFGSSVHKAVEFQLKMQQKLKGKNVPLAAVIKAYEKEVKIQALTLEEPYRSKFRDLYEAGYPLVASLYRQMIQYNAIAAEIPFLLDLGYGVPIKGFIDQLMSDGFGELKTLGKWFSPGDIEAMIQLTIYYKAYERLYGEYPKRIRLFMANKKTGEVKMVYVQRGAKHLERMDIIIKNAVEGIRAGKFPRCNKRMCWSCNPR